MPHNIVQSGLRHLMTQTLMLRARQDILRMRGSFNTGGVLTEALALTNSQNANLRAKNIRLRARLEMVQAGMLPRVASVAVGDPIVCTRNRYRNGLFNGLLGKVTNIDDLRISALWDGESEPRLLDNDAAQDCELAYGITCHRAQGSAASTVLVLLENTPLVTRE